jgi:hypothetical protein
METLRNYGVVCLVLLVLVIDELKGDEALSNVNAINKDNATFVTLSNSTQGINKEKEKKR